jgi:hypothetical protein
MRRYGFCSRGYIDVHTDTALNMRTSDFDKKSYIKQQYIFNSYIINTQYKNIKPTTITFGQTYIYIDKKKY